MTKSSPGNAVTDADVAIVGFGPIGATLASLLGRRGLRVVVIERDLDVFPLPRAAHIDHQSLRLLQELGCLEELLPRMIPNPGVDFVTADRQLLMRVPGDMPSVSGLPSSMYFHQPAFDRVLRRVAASIPEIDVRLGTEMLSLEMRDDGVVVSTRSADGRGGEVKAAWVVGCDGAWSQVRESAEITLQSLNFDEQWLVVDLKLQRPIPSLPDRAVTICDPRRPLFAIPIPDGRFRFELQLHDGEDPLRMQQPDRVHELLEEWLSPNDAEIERSTVYTFHGLVAQPWRVGRVFLAGDAAHQMPPFLGQGMNSGMRDASNLAWKLALVVKGQAPERLLDTYELERRPHVTQVIEASVTFGAIICETDPGRAAERDRKWLLQPEPPEQRLPFSLPSLVPGPLVIHGGGELFIQPPKAGLNGRLDDYIAGRFLVVARRPEQLGKAAEWWREFGALVSTVDELPNCGGPVSEWLQRREADVVVVRPDHYVLAFNSSVDAITARVKEWLTPKIGAAEGSGAN